MKKFFRILVLVVVLAGLFFYLRHSNHTPEQDGVYSGYAEGELVYVASPIGGQVQKLTVKRGDTAKKDETLFELEREEEKAARAEAEESYRESQTRFDKAKLDFDRAKSLRDKRVTSSEDFDTAQQALLGAQHAVAGRQRALEQADWRYSQKVQAAPSSGLVYDTYYRPGEWVSAGTPLLSLLPPEYMKVRFFVPESDLGRMKVGAPVEVHMDGLPSALPAKVSFVSPQAEYTLPIIYSRENRAKLVFLVEASLDPESARQLHPGAPVEVRLKP